MDVVQIKSLPHRTKVRVVHIQPFGIWKWTHKFDTCSICKEEIYGWGHNPQSVIVEGKKLEVSDSCCSDCNDNLVLPTRQTSTNDRKDLN